MLRDRKPSPIAPPTASAAGGMAGPPDGHHGLRGRSAGFTLVEVIFAASIVAILATIAYPSYLQHIATSRRADAQGALLGLAAAMERHATTHNFKYTGAAGSQAASADSGDPWVFAKTVPVSGGTATYNLKIAASADTSFTLEAIPTGAQAKDKCGTLTLTSAGVRGIKNAQEGVKTDDCWRK